MPTVEQTRYDKVLSLIDKQCGGSKTRFAEVMGVTKQYISNMTRDREPRPIGKQFSRRIEKQFSLPVGWLDEMTVSASIVEKNDAVEISLLDVRGALGPSMELQPHEEVIQRIWINTQWVRDNLRGSSAKSLAVITGKGDSMSPTIDSDTPLLVDTTANSFDRDAIYVFTNGSKLFINRIQRDITGNGVTILSDNPAYKPQSLTEQDLMGINVLGRVIKRIRFEPL